MALSDREQRILDKMEDSDDPELLAFVAFEAQKDAKFDRKPLHERLNLRKPNRIQALTAASGLAITSFIGVMGYLVYDAHEHNAQSARADEATAVARVLKSPMSLAAMGICPGELKQQALDLPAETAQYDAGASLEQRVLPNCTTLIKTGSAISEVVVNIAKPEEVPFDITVTHDDIIH